MLTILENDFYKLCLEDEKYSNHDYVLYQKTDIFNQPLFKSHILTKKILKPFSKIEISKIKSTIHAIKYVNKRFSRYLVDKPSLSTIC